MYWVSAVCVKVKKEWCNVLTYLLKYKYIKTNLKAPFATAAETIQPVYRMGIYNSSDIDWFILAFSHSKAQDVQTLSGFVHSDGEGKLLVVGGGMRCTLYLILVPVPSREHGRKATESSHIRTQLSWAEREIVSYTKKEKRNPLMLWPI